MNGRFLLLTSHRVLKVSPDELVEWSVTLEKIERVTVQEDNTTVRLDLDTTMYHKRYRAELAGGDGWNGVGSEASHVQAVIQRQADAPLHLPWLPAMHGNHLVPELALSEDALLHDTEVYTEEERSATAARLPRTRKCTGCCGGRPPADAV